MGRIVDVTVVLQHQVPTRQTVRKTVEVSTAPAEVVDSMTRVARHRLSHYCEHQSHLVQQRLEWHWTLGHFHVTVFLWKFQVEPKARLRTRSCPDGQVAYEADSTAPRLTSQTDRKRIFCMSGPLSLFLRGPRLSGVRSRQTRGPELCGDAVTDFVLFLEKSIIPMFSPLRAVGVDAPSCLHHVTESAL